MRTTLNQDLKGLYIDRLAEVLIERHEGYRIASEKMLDPYLKQLFFSHSNFTLQMIKEISTYADENFFYSPFDKWKIWDALQHAMVTEDRGDLLEACIKGEQNSISILQDILKDKTTPLSLKDLVRKQLSQIKPACDLLKIFIISL